MPISNTAKQALDYTTYGRGDICHSRTRRLEQDISNNWITGLLGNSLMYTIMIINENKM
jgi:hypothetical protein